MTIDERIEALVMTCELLTRDVEALRDTAQLTGKEVAAVREAAAQRDAEYDKLRHRLLRGALGLMGVDESEGEDGGQVA